MSVALLLASLMGSPSPSCPALIGAPEVVGLITTSSIAPGTCPSIRVERLPDGQLRITRGAEVRVVADAATARVLVASWRRRDPIAQGPQPSAPRTATHRLHLGASLGVDSTGWVWQGIEFGADLSLGGWVVSGSAQFSYKPVEEDRRGGVVRGVVFSRGEDLQVLLAFGPSIALGPVLLLPGVAAGWGQVFRLPDLSLIETNEGIVEEDLRLEVHLRLIAKLKWIGLELLLAGGTFPTYVEVDLGAPRSTPVIGGGFRGRVALAIALESGG